MEYLIYLIAFAIDILITGIILWVAAMMTRVNLLLKETVICALGASLAALIPTIGWLLSLVILFYLLKRFSQADVWPDLILMVIISRLFAFFANILLFSLTTL